MLHFQIITWSSIESVIDYNEMMHINDQESGTGSIRQSSILEVLEQNESIPREHLILVILIKLSKQTKLNSSILLHI